MSFAARGEGRGIQNKLGSGPPTEVQMQILHIARQGCLAIISLPLHTRKKQTLLSLAVLKREAGKKSCQ